MHDKFKSCKDCPDRCLEPNCHDTCEGNKARQAKAAAINEIKRKNNDMYAYKRDRIHDTIKRATSGGKKRHK